jgi:pimeloyl-ACP methyl ester carboxylesterase
MRRPRLLAALLCTLSVAVPSPSSMAASVAGPTGVSVDTVIFRVTNPAVPGEIDTVRGWFYRPSSAPTCASSVLLLLHGHSFGAFGWDPAYRPERYSVARALAAAGYPSVAIDELGYGSSDHPNGRTLTVQTYADVTSQIVDQLRRGTYGGSSPVAFSHVGLAGHSAGAEIAELTAGSLGGIDALLALGYMHAVKAEFGREFVTQEIPRAVPTDYVYWGGTFDQNAKYHGVTREFVEQGVIDEYRRRLNLVPSGEILSISNQPSRWVVPSIRVPLLLVLAEKDYIFPADDAAIELALFTGAADKTLRVVRGAAHSFMLEPSAPETNAFLVGWLRRHPAAVPPC